MTANILRRFQRARSYLSESLWLATAAKRSGGPGTSPKSVFVLVRTEAGVPYQVPGTIGF
jgi:hypothetical protein